LSPRTPSLLVPPRIISLCWRSKSMDRKTKTLRERVLDHFAAPAYSSQCRGARPCLGRVRKTRPLRPSRGTMVPLLPMASGCRK
jgi:hypothetical protein